MTTENLKLVVDALGAILVPVVVFFLGHWFIRSKAKSDSAREDAAQLAAFLEHLSSERKETRKLALLALTHMRNADLFPTVLFEAVQSIAAGDEPEVAAFAQLALGDAQLNKGLSQEDRTRLLELLLPMKVHFERTDRAFKRWTERTPTRLKKPNLEIEDAIFASNTAISSLLRKKWHLIPSDLQEDAARLIEHYDAWVKEYHRLRPGGVRDETVPYVFVAQHGFPFPVDAEEHFLSRYSALAGGKPAQVSSELIDAIT